MINGGFGLVLDGTEEAAERLKMMLSWDVLNGVGVAFDHSTTVSCNNIT